MVYYRMLLMGFLGEMVRNGKHWSEKTKCLENCALKQPASLFKYQSDVVGDSSRKGEMDLFEYFKSLQHKSIQIHVAKAKKRGI